jgi:oxygen-independent coproporphyrinogen-3 oxidase
MAGLYLHIPFCAQACSYCNFHFSTSLKTKDDLLKAMVKEIRMKANDQALTSIYFGGGTPSVLSAKEVASLMAVIRDSFRLEDMREVTFEVNPEDVNQEYLQSLKELGITRLSVGIQSFDQKDLESMNRAHNAQQAHQALEDIGKIGFNTWTMDLIYGLPWAPADRFSSNLDLALKYQAPHLSCYALTVEPKTALAYQIEKGIQKNVDDNLAFEDFSLLQSWAKSNDFEHYEISNLARPGHKAVHNSNYWSGENYIGIGPSAHGFDGVKRTWNVANNIKYIKSLTEGRVPEEHEVLTESERYNEWVMTGLRLNSGLEAKTLATFHKNIQQHFIREVGRKMDHGILIAINGRYMLATNQRFFADGHAADLFYIDE